MKIAKHWLYSALMNILLIDDDRDFLFLLSRKISQKGHAVYTAQNGIQALSEMDLHKIDLVISDVIMRDTPILSLTCVLKKLYPETPLILISGLPGEPLVNSSLQLGADEFLPKPLNFVKLMTMVGRLGAQA